MELVSIVTGGKLGRCLVRLGSLVQRRVYFYKDKVLCLVCVAPFTFVSSFLPLLSLGLAGGDV